MDQVKKEIISQLKLLDNDWTIITDLPSAQPRDKSLECAQKSRQDGNRKYASCHSADDLRTVYECYAQSIASAPPNSQEMALAYSNLSAVLYRLQKYSECLEAIDCCLSLDYPEKSKFKIYLRKIECLKIVNEPLKAKDVYDETLTWIETNQVKDDEKMTMKLKLEDCYKKQVVVERKGLTDEEINKVWKDFSIKTFNEEIPGASSAISLKYNESHGRHFVATRDIRPGEVLIKERTYEIVCSKDAQYQYCWKCHKLLANCIPCDYCKNVIFCSLKCKDEAWKNYHHQECELLPHFFNIPVMFQSEFTYIVMAFRILVRSIREYGTIKRLRKALDEMYQSSEDPRTKGFTNGKLLNDRSIVFYSLKSHDDYPNAIRFAVYTIYQVATKTTLLGEKINPRSKGLYQNEDFVYAACLIAKLICILTINSNETEFFDNRSQTQTLSGLHSSILANLINHSCMENVKYYSSTTYNELVATLPIKKGEEIFNDYYGAYKTLERTDKRTRLQKLFHFICNCDACTSNWPSPDKYPSVMQFQHGLQLRLSFWIMHEMFKEALEAINDRNYKFMVTFLESLSERIEEFFDLKFPQPCLEHYGLSVFMFYFFSKLRKA